MYAVIKRAGVPVGIAPTVGARVPAPAGRKPARDARNPFRAPVLGACGPGLCAHPRLDAALVADVVFAKDSLARDLSARGAAFRPFATLDPVLGYLESLEAQQPRV